MRLASSGVFALRYPAHPMTELHRRRARGRRRLSAGCCARTSRVACRRDAPVPPCMRSGARQPPRRGRGVDRRLHRRAHGGDAGEGVPGRPGPGRDHQPSRPSRSSSATPTEWATHVPGRPVRSRRDRRTPRRQARLHRRPGPGPARRAGPRRPPVQRGVPAPAGRADRSIYASGCRFLRTDPLAEVRARGPPGAHAAVLDGVLADADRVRRRGDPRDPRGDGGDRPARAR